MSPLSAATAVFGRLVARVRERAPRGDAGMTLIELMVGMLIMGIFMGMFTGAMYLMSSTANTVQVVSDTSNQATAGFLRLDREVRYASAISTPTYDAAAQAWHVEFLSTNVTRSDAAATTTNQCTQLVVTVPSGSNDGAAVLEQRSWNVGDSAPGGYEVLANSVTNYGPPSGGGSDPDSPFPPVAAVDGGNASASLQQLAIRLVIAQQAPATGSTTSTYTISALNSSVGNTTPICQQFAVEG